MLPSNMLQAEWIAFQPRAKPGMRIAAFAIGIMIAGLFDLMTELADQELAYIRMEMCPVQMVASGLIPLNILLQYNILDFFAIIFHALIK
jgi:hypothetical protein